MCCSTNADGELRQRGELLRIRQYGDRWVLTHKAPVESSANSTHKVRAETETEIEDGRPLAAIFERLGFAPHVCVRETSHGMGR